MPLLAACLPDDRWVVGPILEPARPDPAETKISHFWAPAITLRVSESSRSPVSGVQIRVVIVGGHRFRIVQRFANTRTRRGSYRSFDLQKGRWYCRAKMVAPRSQCRSFGRVSG